MAKVTEGQQEGYTIKNGLLYKKDKHDWLIVVPKQMQDDVIQRCHDQGHFGAAKTEQLIRRDYWFPKKHEKIKQVIQNCVSCILAERKHGKLEGFLHPLNKGDTPMDTYHIDHLDLLPSTKKSHCHILAVIDRFSKSAWLYPIRTMRTSEVVDKLLRQQLFSVILDE